MKDEAGTGLVEVLIAFGILVLGLALFLKSTAMTMALHERSRRNGDALFLAQEKMETLEAFGWESAAPGAERLHSEEKALRGTLYRIVLERNDLPGPLVRYSVSCRWSGKGWPSAGRGSVVLSTVRGGGR